MKPRIDNLSAIFTMIKEMCQYNSTKATDLNDIRDRIMRRGYSEDELGLCLKNYENLNVIMVESGVVTLIDE